MLAFAFVSLVVLPMVSSSAPHVVFILADDMGWDDVSFHGSSQIPTPNLDVLASEGVMLNNYYVMHLCTPSRSALLTGLYPIRTGMVDALDQSVGTVVETLSRARMLNDTIIVFSSDNGGSPYGVETNGGSNWPLRGAKATLWEGGLRVPGFVWSTRLRKRRRVSRQMMHIVDWLPTLYSAAGGNVSALGPIDGVDMWPALSEGSPSPRREVLLNVDPQLPAMAIRMGRYKLLVQAPREGLKNDRYPAQGMRRPVDDLAHLRANSRTAKVLESLYGSLRHDYGQWERQTTVSCNTSDELRLTGGSPYLFDIESDPCETRNLAASHRQVLRSLMKRLSAYVATMVPSRSKPSDPRSYPENFGGVWSPWLD